MSIYAISLNHTCAPLALREQFVYAGEDLAAALQTLQQALNAEVALLSTCNRTELYFATLANTALPEAVLTQAIAALAQTKHLAPAQLARHCQALHGESAVNHVYRVISGLNSMVLGETQIVGQFKQAVQAAQSVGTLGSLLQQLFQHSFSTAKAVRTHTAVGASSVSFAAAAVRLAQQIFGDIAKRKVLMVGAGEMIELCATHFLSHQPLQLTIANRSVDKAGVLAAELTAAHNKQNTATKHGAPTNRPVINPISVIGLAQLPEVLGQYDIVISCTASTLPIIGLGLVQRALAYKAAKRLPKTTMMVDLAVPRDIEIEVGNLGDVYVYTVDDLAKVVQEGRDSRSSAVVYAEQIIQAKVAEFARWQLSRRAVPTIQALQQQAQAIRQAELNKAVAALSNIQGLEQPELAHHFQHALEALSRNLTQKLLHGALHATQQLAADSTVADTVLQTIARSYNEQRAVSYSNTNINTNINTNTNLNKA
jgi:glutamyl-tRNA reductase